MSDEKALEIITKDAASAEIFTEANPEWTKGWVPSELVTRSPFSSAQPTDIELNATIETLLESPEIDAMLENVAADAADDAKAALALPSNLFVQNNGGTDQLEEFRKEFKAFEARVVAAFKHAGFKF